MNRTLTPAAAALLACMLAAAPAHAQGKPRDPAPVAQRPFASLSEFLSSVDSDYASLGRMKQQLDDDKANMKAARSAVTARQNDLDQARRDVEALRSQVQGTNRKWLCNAYGSLHDDPSECTDPDQGGVWVVVDANGQYARWTPPTRADLKRLKAAEKALTAKERDLADAKADLAKTEEEYSKNVEKYNRRADALADKTDGLSDPKQVLQDVRNRYEAAARNNGAADPAVMQGLDKMDGLIGKVSGDGQCVALAKEFAGLGSTRTWKQGDAVGKDGPPAPFAPAATMENGVYPNRPTGNHVVIELDNNRDAMLAFDQYSGKAAGVRLIRHQGGTSAHQAEIDQGEQEAKDAGLTPVDEDGKPNKAYYKMKYKYYNPSNDADNYYYVK